MAKRNLNIGIICPTATLLFFIQWIYLAFDVYSRADWFLENVLVFIFVGPIIYSYIKGYISSFSYLSLITFLSFHSVGSHFTYSLVPYDEITLRLLGVPINTLFDWDRNNFDRFMHFLWGLLLFKPLCDIFTATTSLRRGHVVAFSFLTVTGASTVYELVEWLAAVVFGGDLGVAYVGAQGDVWDAQKDQSLAILGTLVSWGIGRIGFTLKSRQRTP